MSGTLVDGQHQNNFRRSHDGICLAVEPLLIDRSSEWHIHIRD